MSYYLTDEIVESLKEYAARVEKFYHERQICHFDWKPAHIEVDRIHPNKVLFDMVYLDYVLGRYFYLLVDELYYMSSF